MQELIIGESVKVSGKEIKVRRFVYKGWRGLISSSQPNVVFLRRPLKTEEGGYQTIPAFRYMNPIKIILKLSKEQVKK